MSTAYLVAGVRTPIGRYGGALAPVRPDDLAAHVLRTLVNRLPSVDWAAVDDVVMGCANQAGEDNRDVARMAVLLAELPTEVAGTTVNRLCGSGLDAVGIAARAIRAGDADLVIAGGVESSQVVATEAPTTRMETLAAPLLQPWLVANHEQPAAVQPRRDAHHALPVSGHGHLPNVHTLPAPCACGHRKLLRRRDRHGLLIVDKRAVDIEKDRDATRHMLHGAVLSNVFGRRLGVVTESGPAPTL
jgi:hypothetical protein